MASMRSAWSGSGSTRTLSRPNCSRNIAARLSSGQSSVRSLLAPGNAGIFAVLLREVSDMQLTLPG
jgi:hypothetical protein